MTLSHNRLYATTAQLIISDRIVTFRKRAILDIEDREILLPCYIWFIAILYEMCSINVKHGRAKHQNF